MDAGISASPEQAAWRALDNEDQAAAEEAATRCLAIDPDSVSCNEALVCSFSRFGKFDEAAPAVERCLALDPENTTCLGVSFTLQIRDGDIDGAVEIADRIRKTDENGVQTELDDAMIAEARGQRDEATSHYRAACAQGQEYACVRAKALTEKGPMHSAGVPRYRVANRKNDANQSIRSVQP